jgi:hypothetical protein
MSAQKCAQALLPPPANARAGSSAASVLAASPLSTRRREAVDASMRVRSSNRSLVMQVASLDTLTTTLVCGPAEAHQRRRTASHPFPGDAIADDGTAPEAQRHANAAKPCAQ